MPLPKKKVYLERAISKRGFASRKEANSLIKMGKVTIDGKKIFDPLFLVYPETMKIKIEGVETKKKTMPILIMFNKPKDCVTTTKDEKNRKTVFDYLTEFEFKLISVGRLDYKTTGLLFFTNENLIMEFLTNPKNEIKRTYVATIRNEILESTILNLLTGIKTKEGFYKANSIEILKKSKKESHIKVTLLEGKNREIRNMFKHFNHEVTDLKRISFGDFFLDINIGKNRIVSFEELAINIPQTKPLLKKLLLIK